MDIQMPNMDGCMATQSIRNLSDSEKTAITIVGMMANSFREDKNNACGRCELAYRKTNQD